MMVSFGYFRIQEFVISVPGNLVKVFPNCDVAGMSQGLAEEHTTRVTEGGRLRQQAARTL
jgi:hypothetical protein